MSPLPRGARTGCGARLRFPQRADGNAGQRGKGQRRHRLIFERLVDRRLEIGGDLVGLIGGLQPLVGRGLGDGAGAVQGLVDLDAGAVGKFGGLAETMDEAIRYPISTPRDGDAVAPCVLAGPTCDSADVLYEKNPYPLPLSLSIGDEVLIENTGAYTTTYSAVAFNGFEPLRAYVI